MLQAYTCVHQQVHSFMTQAALVCQAEISTDDHDVQSQHKHSGTRFTVQLCTSGIVAFCNDRHFARGIKLSDVVKDCPNERSFGLAPQ